MTLATTKFPASVWWITLHPQYSDEERILHSLEKILPRPNFERGQFPLTYEVVHWIYENGNFVLPRKLDTNASLLEPKKSGMWCIDTYFNSADIMETTHFNACGTAYV